VIIKGGIIIKEDQYSSKQHPDPVKIGKNIIGQFFPEVTSKSSQAELYLSRELLEERLRSYVLLLCAVHRA
jgi:hypothetical protein